MGAPRNDVTRFGSSGAGGASGGATNAGLGQPWADIGQFDPTKYANYFHDFMSMIDFAVATGTSWTVTKTEGGAGSAAIARVDGLGGWMAITNDAASGDNFFAQLIGEPVRWSPSKRLIFDCRFKLDSVLLSSVVMGLQITDTTPLDVTDGIFFLVTSGAATVDFRVEKDNAASAATAFTTLVADTMVRLTFVYNGVPRDNAGVATYDFDVYVDGVFSTSVAATTNVPDDEDLTVSFGIQNGSAVARVMTIDFVGFALER